MGLGRLLPSLGCIFTRLDLGLPSLCGLLPDRRMDDAKLVYFGALLG
jgi:hypothetical protein